MTAPPTQTTSCYRISQAKIIHTSKVQLTCVKTVWDFFSFFFLHSDRLYHFYQNKEALQYLREINLEQTEHVSVWHKNSSYGIIGYNIEVDCDRPYVRVSELIIPLLLCYIRGKFHVKPVCWHSWVYKLGGLWLGRSDSEPKLLFPYSQQGLLLLNSLSTPKHLGFSRHYSPSQINTYRFLG